MIIMQKFSKKCMENKGLKYDQGKQRWDLLDWDIVCGIVDILTYGSEKYAPNSWQYVENAKERYFSALMRHLIAWRKGEIKDSESGRSHLYHVACNLMFLKHFDE